MSTFDEDFAQIEADWLAVYRLIGAMGKDGFVAALIANEERSENLAKLIDAKRKEIEAAMAGTGAKAAWSYRQHASALPGPKPTCVVRIDKDGNQSFMICGDARLLMIDETAPGDRVHQIATQITEAELHKLIDGDAIGHDKNERHEAIKARVLAGLEKRKHLAIIKDGKP